MTREAAAVVAGGSSEANKSGRKEPQHEDDKGRAATGRREGLASSGSKEEGTGAIPP